MSVHVSEALARLVVNRAENRCEYCRISIEDTYFGGEVDHIRSLKHGGSTSEDNLALACQPCNRNKGSDLGSITEGSGLLTRFFDPRVDDWNEHFVVKDSGEIIPITDVGRVTASIFQFNIPERIDERAGLIELGRFTIDQ